MRKLLYYGEGSIIAVYAVLLVVLLVMYAPNFLSDERPRGLLLLAGAALPVWAWLLIGDQARAYLGGGPRGARWLLLPPAALILSLVAVGLTS